MDVGIQIHSSDNLEVRAVSFGVEELDGFIVFHWKVSFVVLCDGSHLGQPGAETAKPALALIGWYRGCACAKLLSLPPALFFI